jgi:hypothetical protein
MGKLFSILILGLALFAAQNAFTNAVPVGQVVYPSIVIPSPSPTSSAMPTSGMSLVGCQLPATVTSTAMTFQVSSSLTGTYEALYNSAGQVSYTIASGRFIAINPTDFYGVQFYKIVFGSSEAANRTLVCSMKGI